MVGLVAMFVPGFGFFISLIGSLACSVLAFVIPALCHLSLFGEEMPRYLSSPPPPNAYTPGELYSLSV